MLYIVLNGGPEDFVCTTCGTLVCVPRMSDDVTEFLLRGLYQQKSTSWSVSLKARGQQKPISSSMFFFIKLFLVVVPRDSSFSSDPGEGTATTGIPEEEAEEEDGTRSWSSSADSLELDAEEATWRGEDEDFLLEEDPPQIPTENFGRPFPWDDIRETMGHGELVLPLGIPKAEARRLRDPEDKVMLARIDAFIVHYRLSRKVRTVYAVTISMSFSSTMGRQLDDRV